MEAFQLLEQSKMIQLFPTRSHFGVEKEDIRESGKEERWVQREGLMTNVRGEEDWNKSGGFSILCRTCRSS